MDIILEPEPAGSPVREGQAAESVRMAGGTWATVTCNQVAVTYPAAWTSEGCATPDDPLFLIPADEQQFQRLVVSVVPAAAQTGFPEMLLHELRQFVHEWAGLERDPPRTGTCALGHYATMTFRLPRSGRVLWFQRWHCSDGRIQVVASHTSSGVPSEAAKAEMHRIVMGIVRAPAPAEKPPAGAGAKVSGRRPWWRFGWKGAGRYISRQITELLR